MNVLSKHLSYFHPVTGFLPDILHIFFEGVVPVELSLCLRSLFSKGYVTLDRLNSLINSFPYKYSDRVNKPKVITKANVEKGSIGGNGHENWSLLHFLPLLMGKSVPEQEPAWGILMDLKEIVKIVVSPVFWRKYCITWRSNYWITEAYLETLFLILTSGQSTTLLTIILTFYAA